MQSWLITTDKICRSLQHFCCVTIQLLYSCYLFSYIHFTSIFTCLKCFVRPSVSQKHSSTHTRVRTHTHTPLQRRTHSHTFLSHSLTHKYISFSCFRLKLAVFNDHQHVCDKSIHNPVIATYISYNIVITQCTHWLLSTRGADNVIKIYYAKPLTCISTSARISSTCYCCRAQHMWCICTNKTLSVLLCFSACLSLSSLPSEVCACESCSHNWRSPSIFLSVPTRRHSLSLFCEHICIQSLTHIHRHPFIELETTPPRIHRLVQTRKWDLRLTS